MSQPTTPKSTPNGTGYRQQPRPTPVSLTLRRRERDLQHRLEQQHAQGRPCSLWKLCGDPSCEDDSCMNKVPLFIIQNKDYSMDNINVKSIASDFAGLVTDVLWAPRKGEMDNFMTKLHAVESLVASPPVRDAYLEFQPYCAKLGLSKDGEMKLRCALLEAMPRLHELMEKVGEPEHAKTVHSVLRRPKDEDVGESWMLQDCIMRFLLAVELWRRADPEHVQRRRWTFESDRVVAQLLCVTLLHLWQLDREKCFDVVPCKGGAHWDEVWQEWMDKYPLLTQDGEKDDDYETSHLRSYEFVPRPQGEVKRLDVEKELGYLGGVGMRAEPKKPRRQL